MPTPRLSIRKKWTFALITAAWVPLLLACWRGLDIQRAGLRNVEQELEAAVVDQVAGEITLAFDEVTDAARYAAKIATDARIPAVARTSLLQQRVGVVDSLSSMVLYDGDRVFIDALVKPNVPPPSREPLDPGMVEELLATGSARRIRVEPDGRVVAAFAASDEERLFVVAYADLGVIADRTKELSTVRFGVPDRVDVVTPAQDGTFRSMTFGGRPSTLPAALFPRVPTAETAGALFHDEFLRTTEFASASGEQVSATLRSVPRANLAVSVVRPTREAYIALERTKQQFLVVILAVAVLAVTFGWLFARQITRPIGSLVDLVRRYAQREWGARSNVKSGDELEALGDALTTMATQIAASEEEITRRATVEAGLARYLPGDVARQIASGERSLALGGERKEVAVLFADVANFTRFAESRPVEDVVTFLNELFGILSEIVFRHGGMVDKFMGDCVMALFGASPSVTDGPADPQGLQSKHHAVAAAEDMMRFVEANAEEWQRRWGFDVKLGIGVSSGPALVGNLGSEARMEFTAIGDTVNVASRLEGLARPGQVLVTTEIEAATKSDFDFAPIGKVPLRGKAEDVELYALVTD